MTDAEIKSIPISAPVLGVAEIQAVREVLESGWVTQGPRVAAFEERFAKVHKVKYAVAVNSCTSGLHLVLHAMGIGQGDEVIVPAFTWVSTANVVAHCGATPVFVDVERDSFNIDPLLIEEAITDQTRAIIPVHLFGLCANMEAIQKTIPSNLKILEDAACAVGAEYQGTPAGGLGDAAVFSFHPRKTITTGEGGMITTNDEELTESLRRLRNHGASVSEETRHHDPKPHALPVFDDIGFNYRMTDMQGSVGLEQLHKLEQFISERAEWAEWYRQKLSEFEWIRCPVESQHGCHGWQAFVTWIDPDKSPVSRNDLMDRLHARGIATRPGTHALHDLGAYRKYQSNCPVASECAAQTMALPFHNRMTGEDYIRVVEELKRVAISG